MKFDAHAYEIRTRRLTENGENYFKATVSELPHLATYESTAQEAYDVLVDDIEALYASSIEMGHPFPAPNVESSSGHSGRITLRLPKALHSTLDRQRMSEGVSLNLHVVALLMQGATMKDVVAHAGDAIKTVARSSITAAALMRGEETARSSAITASYSNVTQIDISESEPWTTTH